MSTTILSTRGLSMSYQDQHVLHHVDLIIRSGEVLGVIGRSGSGKTTLVRLLAGLLQPDSGQVLYEGEELEGPEDKLVPGHEEIRLVHQDFKLKHKMTVRENIRYELLSYVDEYQQERIEALMKLCNITHLQDTDIAYISGGEKQRVAIARAMATEPAVVLMDEPFSNLDLMTKAELLSEIKQIASSTDTAIVLITHDTRDALEVADRLAVLQAGKIVQMAPTHEIYQSPASPYVAGLFGLYSELSSEELHQLSGTPPQTPADKYGLWPEDIYATTDSSGEAQVTTVAFLGAYHRLRIQWKNHTLWAYDPQKNVQQGDTVRISVNFQNAFPLS
ncbi:ABC transporter ATP-binding protein [Marinoscillum furvescens]|uniref:Iron(III) transport system ATP-binding protein n=1 Tax=Marinoscillum furvescens DSM 4134 TaxID=1122208 RepID=A0A3D9KVU2_MARFU|nr:ABC transporter ATP-binding protein [Marinoscillum furvescens]RED91777.1 iron(III) transport system ATP-binding protein [Marinoscillum furvescens DSM 4134]